MASAGRTVHQNQSHFVDTVGMGRLRTQYKECLHPVPQQNKAARTVFLDRRYGLVEGLGEPAGSQVLFEIPGQAG